MDAGRTIGMPCRECSATQGKAPPRLLQELGETLQRLRLGGPFYVLLWLLAGTASGLWQRAPWPFVLVALVFLVLVVMRFRIHGTPAGSDENAVQRRLDHIWVLLLTNAGAWGAASAWLLMVTPNESARTVAAISSYAFATAFAHNFPMRLSRAYAAVALTYLPTLGAFIANGSRVELVAVSFLYCTSRWHYGAAMPSTANASTWKTSCASSATCSNSKAVAMD